MRAAYRHPAGPVIGLVFCWAVVTTVGPLSDARVHDLFVYRTYEGLIAGGLAPYREIAMEYPPLALVPIVLGGVPGGGDLGFDITFAILMLLLTIALMPFVGSLAGERPWVAWWAIGLSPLLLGASVRTHFDAWPVLLVIAALWAFVRDRPVLAGALLGAGAMAKGFPLLVLPLAVAWLLGRGRDGDAVRAAVACIGVCVVVSAPFLSEGYVDAYSFHLDRPTQIESSPATVVWVLGDSHVTGTTATPDRFKSNGLAGGGADIVAPLFAAALLLVLAAITWLAALSPDPRRLLLSAFAATVAFMALGKVLSPQFMIWLVPFGALALAWREWVLALLVAVAMGLTLYEFPVRYIDLVREDEGVVAVVGVRNGVLLVLLGVLLWRLRAAGAPARSPEPAAALRT